MWRHLFLGVLAGLVLLYLVMLILLFRARRRGFEIVEARDVLRLLPDVLRLLRRLVSDSSLPRGIRLSLLLLIGYLACPIDLIPDFIPVLGYADDAIIVAIAIRWVVRHAGPQAVEQHWPGTPAGLHVIQRLAGVDR